MIERKNGGNRVSGFGRDLRLVVEMEFMYARFGSKREKKVWNCEKEDSESSTAGILEKENCFQKEKSLLVNSREWRMF